MNNKKLEEVFDVEVTEVIPPTKPSQTLPAVPPKPKQTARQIRDEELEKFLHEDLAAFRTDLDTIVDNGQSALAEVLSIATQGQHPRFFEAAAMLIKSINEANRERIELHLKVSQIRKNQAETAGGGAGGGINIEKGVFLGTTQQLLEMLNTKKPLTHEPTPDSE